MYIGLHVKYRLYMSDFNKTWILSTDFSKNTQISNLMKIRHMSDFNGTWILSTDFSKNTQISNLMKIRHMSDFNGT
jgi:flagellar biosynthesis/type III secretory pathway chaperone